MGWFKDWRERRRAAREATEGAKSYYVHVLVSDEGFMVAQNFTGGSLYTVLTQAIWTYICASRISQDVAGFPAIVQTREPGTNRWRVDPAHPLNDLLERPYGTAPVAPRWNWQQMIAAGALRQELGGNQFYRIASAGSRLLALQLYLNELKANEDTTTGLFTTYTPHGFTEEIPADEIVNVMSANPDSFWEGVSATIANEQATRVDYAASRRSRYDMETRVQPGVVFKVEGLFSLQEDRRDAVETYLAAQYEGASKAGKSLVVGDKTEIQGAPIHQVDDLPTHAANARDAIISSYHVSPPVVGVLRDVKYQTWEQALRAQFFLCVSPRLRNLYGAINSQAIRPLYGPNVRLWYDLVQSPLGLAALRERGETAKIYMDLGYPANALNERFQLEMPDFDELDRPNMGAVVAGRAPDLEGSDQEPETDEEPAAAATDA